MAESTYLGLNKSGVSKIQSALKKYKNKIKSVDFGATSKTVQVYAKGSSSEKQIVSGLNAIETRLDNLLNNKIEPFDKRLGELANAYSKNDTTQGTNFNTSAKNVLKS